eukprot:COSAG01_NODE_71121_length_257_cov_0.158228_1_plen_37_part_10
MELEASGLGKRWRGRGVGRVGGERVWWVLWGGGGGGC